MGESSEFGPETSLSKKQKRKPLTLSRCRTEYQGRPLRVRQDKTQSGPIPALTPTERGPPLFPEPPGDAETAKQDAPPQARPTGLAGKRANLPPLRLAPSGYGAFGGQGGRFMEQGNMMTPSVSPEFREGATRANRCS